MFSEKPSVFGSGSDLPCSGEIGISIQFIIEMMVYLRFLLLLIASSFFITSAFADESQELLEIKNTTLNLIEALVEEGLLSREKAESLIKRAAAKAANQAKQGRPSESTGSVAAGTGSATTVQEADVVRVPYVPEFVRDEIRQQVKAELREDVLADVKQTAKTERWGIPDALPEWLSRVHFFGDLRLRGEADLYASDNFPNNYLNFNAINQAGGIIPAGRAAFLNSTLDRYRGRLRARLGMNIDVTDNLMAGFRVTTGNLRNIVSTTQTLQNLEGRFQVGLDWAYLQYEGLTADHYKWLTLQGGRTPNPWFTTDLVWDDDISFAGLIGKFRAGLGSNDSLYTMDEHAQNLFLTTAIIPLQETAFDFPSDFDYLNKWLAGAQTGLDWTFQDQSNFKFGVAYYHYFNVEGVRNSINSTAQDSTAPSVVQKGNTMFDIRTDGDPNTQLFALASKFQILNLTGRYDYAGFAPIHVIATADYARNLGFSKQDIFNRIGPSQEEFFRRTGRMDLTRRVNAWSAKLQVGWPMIRKWGDWNLFVTYKYLERDAVLDAFTDSNFHFGGTDAKGFILGARFGLTYHTSLQWRWMTANAIDGPPLGIDVMLLDLTTEI